ncbi:MAG: energy transducer TonB, partial [Acidobacteriota bacterium]
EKSIFTVIEYEPLWCRVIRELQIAATQLQQDPKGFLKSLLQGDPRQRRVKIYLRIGAVSALFLWALGGLLYLGWHYWQPLQSTQLDDPAQKLMLITRLVTPMPSHPAPRRAGGGGGGGNRTLTPPSYGRPPVATLAEPILPPTSLPAKIEHPSLPVLPTIQAQPELIPQPNLVNVGLLNGVIAPPSDGPGSGKGIGTGQGGGAGAGTDKGYGPGSGGNTGGGWRQIGGNGEPVYRVNQAGVKRPQLHLLVKPKYTEEARRNKIQGVVQIMAVFRADGRITDIKVVRGLGHGLDEEAVKAALLIKFTPGTKDGHAADVQASLEYTFTLL